MPASINLACEGAVDEAVARRLILAVGANVGLSRPSYGKAKLDRDIPKLVRAAARMPWFVLRDLDRDAVCAGELVQEFGASDVPLLCFRVAVVAVESWFMADRSGFASLLRIVPRQVPDRPDELDNPKARVIDLARTSRNSAVVGARTPGRKGQGPAYSAWLARFATDRWDVLQAVQSGRSPSLSRSFGRLSEFAASLERLEE